MRFAALFLAISVPGFCDGPVVRQIRVQPTDTVIPHIVDGGPWKTTIRLVNLSDQVATYKLSFYGDDGLSTSFEIRGYKGNPYNLGPVRVIDGSLPPHGSEVFETVGPGSVDKWGWAELTAITPAGSIGGMATFVAEGPGYPLSEAVVPINSPNDTRLLLPFDNTVPLDSLDGQGYVSSYAIVNPTNARVTVTLTAFNLVGGAAWGTWQFIMEPRSHTAFASVPNPNLAFMENRMGTLDVRTSGAGIAVLGLRFNPRKAFTSFHGLSLPAWITP